MKKFLMVVVFMIVMFIFVVDKMMFLLDWFVNFDYGLIIVVEELGYFVD